VWALPIVNYNLQGEGYHEPKHICTCAKKNQKLKNEFFLEGFNGHSQEGKRTLK
jgi:hypothetical protein